MTTMCKPCKCVISPLQIVIGNILKPIGMLYNAMSVQRQNTSIPQEIPVNHYTGAIPKLTFIFPLSCSE